MENKDMIKIRKVGDPMRKWYRIAADQIMSELSMCPCCKSEDVDRYSAGADEYYRCNDCFCCWEIDKEKVKQEAERRVKTEQEAGLNYFVLDAGTEDKIN